MPLNKETNQQIVRHWSDSRSHQVSTSLLNILFDFMILTLPLISISSSLFSLFLKTIPSAQITIGITVTSKFHCFFWSLTRSRYLGDPFIPQNPRKFFCISFSRESSSLCICHLLVLCNFNLLNFSHPIFWQCCGLNGLDST